MKDHNKELSHLAVVMVSILLIIANEYKWAETTSIILWAVLFYGFMIYSDLVNLFNKVSKLEKKFFNDR